MDNDQKIAPRAKPYAVRRKGFLASGWLAWMALVLVLLFTFSAWHIAREVSTNRVNDRFLYRAEKERDNILRRLQAYDQVLRGGVALFESSQEVTREEWRRYVDYLQLDTNLPGIQNFGVIQVVSARNKESHQRQLRREGFADYAIWPAAEQDIYNVVIFCEPFTKRNRQALGFNANSEPVRRETMERARDTGRPALSARLTLVNESPGSEQPGFLIFLPIYAHNLPTDTIQARRQALTGYAFMAFRASDLIRSIIGSDSRDVDLELFDEAVSADTLLFDSRAGETHGKRGQYVTYLPLDLASHHWVARFQSQPEFDLVTTSYLPDSIAVVGLLLGLMIFIVIFTNARNQQQVETIAERLAESENSLRNILESTPDTVFIVRPDGGFDYLNPQAGKLLGYSPEQLRTLSIRELMPENLNTEHRQLFARAFTDGHLLSE